MSQNDNYLKNKIINLVSISTKDRVIFTKLNSSDIFNPLIFYNLKDINTLFNDDKVAKLSNNNDWAKLESKLISLNNFKEFEDYTNIKSIFIPKSKLNLLQSSFVKHKINILEYLKVKFEKLDKKLSNLDNMARVREVDAGDWCLYLARYFLVGPLSNNEIVKSPIFFKEVNINLSDASIKSKESELHINEKLIVYLIKQEKKSATLLKEWNELTNIQDVIKFLNINFDFDLSLPNSQLDFINEDMPKTKSRSNGKLKIEDTYIFGFFQPKGGKLKQDLEYIIDIEADVFGDKDKTPILNPKEVILDENSKWIQISSLNLSQLFALNLSLRSNTIIHGPPGTGKSETISNIIANIMINNKTALMVSEKKAALDVLLDRLGPLKDFGMFFQDTKVTKDKVIFYNTIKRLSDVYNNFDCDNLNSQYSDTSFEYLIKEKQKLNEAFTIMNEIRSWNINDFNYNQYLEAKYEILNKKILEVIKEHKLNEISKSNFFSLKTLSLFLVNKNLLELDLSEKKLIAIKKSFVIFKNQIVELNKFWLKVSKYDLNALSILEINRIGNTQKNIEILFQVNPNLQRNFKEDIFKYEKMEEVYFEFTLICDKLGVSREVLEKLFNENNVYKLQEALNKSGVLDKKYVIANWFFKNEIITSGFEKIKMPNWKSVLILISKINKSKTRMDDFYIYMRNKKLLSPINVFFLINGFIFDRDLSLYIENNWLQFNSIIPVVTHDNAITFEMAQLANKVYAFESKYDTPQNSQIIQKYKEINKEIYAKNDINWSKIIKEIYIKLVIAWREKINNSLHKEDIIEIFRISNLKRFPKIKTLIKKYFLSLLEIFPIWISRPEDVADIIECKEKIFDYGIFDEASQMFLERAYPILYRTNIKIVAGDDKQLKPSSFFNTRYIEDDEDDETDNQDQKDEDGNYKIKYSDLDSLLLRAIVSNWNEILLNNHYRSVSQDLIDFSNKHIYDNKLNIATFNKSFDSKALQVVNVNGYFINRINKEEATQIIEIIIENLSKYKKILIITFNEAQSEHITSRILSSKNKEMILKMRESNIIITNLENVQGNEGDLVILSIAYARPSNDKKMRNSFGPLNMDGGKNRLNVAVTRAKKKMIIVKSFKADDMSVSPTNLNAQFFKEFIKHCDDVYRNVESEKKWLSFDTKFENDVHTTLENYILSNTDLSLMTRYKIGTKRIDIAVFDKKLDKVILGIELHKWDDNNPEILEEFDKQTFIEKRGYLIYNIFEITWRVNKESIISEILDLL